MIITGEWHVGDDGIPRPVVRGSVITPTGQSVPEYFLVDTGADQSVISASVLSELHFIAQPSPTGFALKGIGGNEAFVVIHTTIEFTIGEGGPARVQGDFPAFTDPTATDVSILGNDVLRNFDVIASQRRNEVLLISGHHRYQVALD